MRRLVNVKNDDAFTLVVAWLLGVLRPSGPYTMLYLAGDAAPTGAAHLARAMFGPAMLILAIGIVDDLWSVRPLVKLGVQVIAALWVYFVLDIRIELLANPLGGESMLGALSLPATC